MQNLFIESVTEMMNKENNAWFGEDVCGVWPGFYLYGLLIWLDFTKNKKSRFCQHDSFHSTSALAPWQHSQLELLLL